MEISVIVIIVVAVGVLFFSFYHLFHKMNILLRERKDDKSVLLIQEQLKEINAQLERSSERTQTRLEEANKALQSQFATSASIIGEVTRKLTQLDETNKQVLGFTDKLQRLEYILKNPKQRGIFGEYFLEALLSNVFQPHQYRMQYKFKNGEVVDAVIFFKEMMIPIDAKFSLEKYNLIIDEESGGMQAELEKDFKNDAKMRIDETAKYIRPNEGTSDFAFMFIPAEGVYYHLLMSKVGAVNAPNQNDLVEYAFKRRVIITSPTSFFAYLQTVLQGLKALQVEESVKEVIQKISELAKHLGSYEEYFKKIGVHLGTTVSMYNQAYGEFKKIDKDFYRITGDGGKVQIASVEKPAAF